MKRNDAREYKRRDEGASEGGRERECERKIEEVAKEGKVIII